VVAVEGQPAATPPIAAESEPAPNDKGPRRHDGFYLRVRSGAGYLSAFGDGPSGSASVSGVSNYAGVAVGGATAPGLAVAGFIWGGTTTNQFSGGPFAQATVTATTPAGVVQKTASINATASLAELGVLADWFPDPTGGWHAGAGAALGLTSVTNQADGSVFAGAGFAGSLFGGYDFWVGRAWSLGLALEASVATSTSLNNTDNKGTGYRLTPMTLGIETSLLYY
jgi:hypothetical protein